MLKTVFAAVAVGVLGTPVWADSGNKLDPASYSIGDRDAYEDDYSDEFDKATKEEHKAHDGKKERLNEKAWEWFEYIKDGDPMWSGPMEHDGGGSFSSLNTRWPMEAAATLSPWHFYLAFSGELYNQQYGMRHQDEEVKWVGLLKLGVAKLKIGLPWRFEFGLRYIFGELSDLGDNDIYWYVGRSPVIHDYVRGVGSKAIEVNLKWNIWKHEDEISGFGIDLKYKKSMAERSDLLDTRGHEGGVNVMGSIKWGIATFHANLGFIYTRNTGTQFNVMPETATDTNPEHPEIRPFATGGLAATLQIFKFLMVVGQIEGHSNAWRSVLDDTYNAHFIGSVMVGMRARMGPMLFEAGIGHGFMEEEARVFGQATIGIKF